MFEVREKPQKVEKAFLVHFYFEKKEAEQASLLLAELEALVESLEIPVIGKEAIFVREQNNRYICGTGKAQEIAQKSQVLKSDCLIVDNVLKPSQQRAWEELLNSCAIDREEVILDIFAQRAKTKEARLQVELARMNYSLPRLSRMWTHLDRQKGGKSVKGDGEQQIEIDRRLARKKIQKCKKELSKIVQQRKTQAKSRENASIPRIAIVGYTNAGKSSLLNVLNKEEVVPVQDALFVTLDSTTKRISLPSLRECLCSDTVGFIRKLPLHLIAAFRSTLESTLEADLLIHLLDGSHSEVEEFYKTTLQVLDDLKINQNHLLTVFNKSDLISPERKIFLQTKYPHSLFISAEKREGIEILLQKCEEFLGEKFLIKEYFLPHQEGKLLQEMRRKGNLLSLQFQAKGILIKAALPQSLENKAKKYQKSFNPL